MYLCVPPLLGLPKGLCYRKDAVVMSEPSGSNKIKSSKKSKKKSKLKAETPTPSSGGSLTSSKSPKSLIKRFNIAKVYNKTKKNLKEESIDKKQAEIDITVSQETLCSMEDETPIEQQITDKILIKNNDKEELLKPAESKETEAEEPPDTALATPTTQPQTPIIETPEIKEEKEDKMNRNDDENEKTDTQRETTPEPQQTEQLENNPVTPTKENYSDPPPSRENEATGGLKKECLYKILVIGELGTGKTSIIKRYVHQFFSQHYRATIGVDFALKVLNWDPNTIIRLQLWDIAGQERFGNMTRVYYKEAVGAFIVFDVTRAATFDAVVKWKQDLDAKVQLADGAPIPCVLLANKCDQQKEGMVNNPAKMDEYCVENKFTAWFETSAKENVNIEEAAKTLVNQILNNDMTNDNGRSINKDNSKFPLDGHLDGGNERRSCTC